MFENYNTFFLIFYTDSGSVTHLFAREIDTLQMFWGVEPLALPERQVSRTFTSLFSTRFSDGPGHQFSNR